VNESWRDGRRARARDERDDEDDEDDEDDGRAVDAGCGDARGDENDDEDEDVIFISIRIVIIGERTTTRDGDDGGAIGGVDVYRCV